MMTKIMSVEHPAPQPASQQLQPQPAHWYRPFAWHSAGAMPLLHTLRRLGVTAMRGLALFLGLFTLANVAGVLAVPTFDANIWWIDLRPLTHWAETPLLILLGTALAAYALRPAMSPARRLVTFVLVAIAAAAAIANTVVYYQLLNGGTLTAGGPVPFSLFITAGCGGILLGLARAAEPPAPLAAVAASAFLCALVFPLLQIVSFGTTDYRRPADAIVVLGAQAYADGRPSRPLAERIATGCELYRAGLAPRIVMSGGMGDGIHETEVMRREAIRLGVPPAAIVIDSNGNNTQQTVEETIPIFRRLGARRVLVVSHAYHLPRIKMTYQRAGWNVFTVPAGNGALLGSSPYSYAREIGGLWAYYFAPLWH